MGKNFICSSGESKHRATRNEKNFPLFGNLIEGAEIDGNFQVSLNNATEGPLDPHSLHGA